MTVNIWISDTLRRFYPQSPAEECEELLLDVAREERCSFQVLLRTDGDPATVKAAVDAPAGISASIRRVGYVPVGHFNTATPLSEVEGSGYLPGLAPDPLLPETAFFAGPWETNAFWITLVAGAQVTPGSYQVTVTIETEEGFSGSCTAGIVVHRAILPPRRGFPVTHWFYADALCDYYDLQPFEEAFWPILERYLEDLRSHGQDTIYVPVFTPPLDGVKRPTQLLGVYREGNNYRFDWTLVRRWVDAARRHGIKYFEWTHLFTQWGAANAIRIYEGMGEGGDLLWPPETTALSDTYRSFLAQYLPELKAFLEEEALMDCSFFHLSDEPHGEEHLENYRADREMLRGLAPWMPVMDALSDIRFAREGLTDIPVPSISVAPEFMAEGFPAWAYFCCGPRGEHLNRLLDTPLTKIRMSGWLFYRLRAGGFLHWGYNYWYRSQTTEMIDPYTVADGLRWPSWPYGDTFVVYPGEEGPVDSLRWEVWAESLQDYALLQAAGIDPEASLLADITDYAAFPRDAGWIRSRRAELLKILDERMGEPAPADIS